MGFVRRSPLVEIITNILPTISDRMPNSVIRLNTYPCLVTMPSGCRGDGCAWGSSGDPRWWKLSRISCRPYRPSYLVLPLQPNFREVSIGGQICGMGIPVGLLHQSAH